MNFMIRETANSTNKTILISSVFNLHKERQTDRGLVTSHSWCQVSPTWEFVNVSTLHSDSIQENVIQYLLYFLYYFSVSRKPTFPHIHEYFLCQFIHIFYT